MVSDTSAYVIRGLAVLARLPEGAYEGAPSVARKVGAREQYLGRLFQSLVREGLVLSQKGLGGGFRLAKDPREISLFDVVEPIEHVSRYEGCLLGTGRCHSKTPCAVHTRWKEVRQAYLDLLKETTVADLAAHDGNVNVSGRKKAKHSEG